MLHVALEDLLDKTDSIYKLTVLAARRALELNMGVPKLIETTDKNPIIVDVGGELCWAKTMHSG